MINTEVGKRVVKYSLEGLVVAFAALVIPQKKALTAEDILSLALVAAATFAVLDLLAPTITDKEGNEIEDTKIADAARWGAGAGIGAKLVGFPMGF